MRNGNDDGLSAVALVEMDGFTVTEHRPHTAHGDLTPSEFAGAWTIKQPEAA